MEKFLSLSVRSPVGSLEYFHMDKEGWIVWIAKMWKPLLDYTPTVSQLSNGWYAFLFLEEAYESRIINGIWFIDKGYLMLWRWWSRFDPYRSKVHKRHLWVLLLYLPLSLWTRESLRVIGNFLKRFITFD